MGVRRGCGRMAGLAVAALLLVSACAGDRRHGPRPDDPDADLASVGRWDDLDDHETGSGLTDLLDPVQRDAMTREGLATDDPPGGDEANRGDTAGKVGLSVLSVALSVGAAVAPFFLF